MNESNGPTDFLLPPLISAVHRQALLTVANDLVNEFEDGLLSILIGGSVGRGDGNALSDLDIFILTNEPWVQRRLLFVDGIHVDIFINNLGEIRSYFDLARTAVILENYASGWILWQRGSVCDSICEEATLLMSKPRKAPSHDEIFTAKLLVISLVKDAIKSETSDPLASAYLLDIVTIHLVELFFRVACLLDPPPKRRLSTIRSHAPDLGNKLEEACCRLPFAIRFEAIAECFTLIFGERMMLDQNHIGSKLII